MSFVEKYYTKHHNPEGFPIDSWNWEFRGLKTPIFTTENNLRANLESYLVGAEDCLVSEAIRHFNTDISYFNHWVFVRLVSDLPGVKKKILASQVIEHLYLVTEISYLQIDTGNFEQKGEKGREKEREREREGGRNCIQHSFFLLSFLPSTSLTFVRSYRYYL